MADIVFNGLVKDLRGSSGDVVFKHQYGRLILSQKPKPRTGPPTAAQLEHQERFKAAVGVANRIFDDPVAAAPYRAAAAARNTSAFALAIADAMSRPEVQEILLDQYTGHVGSSIRVTASDEFGLAKVEVTIRNASGVTIESGPATQSTGGEWVYHGKTEVPANQAHVVEAKATDYATNWSAITEPWPQP